MPFSVADLPTLDDLRVKTSPHDVLIDRVVPGETLVIAFGFVSWAARPDFDFYGRLRKLEQASGRHINKVLVRDSGNTWYHRTIAGLGRHPDETATSLRALVATIAPSKIVTIGQSMGAYAAVMYGLLLDAESVVAFGPLSFLDVQQALLYHERRWLPVMRDLARNPPASGYYDLTALPRGRTALHIVFGTQPDPATATESVNLDAMHAHRLAARGNCTLHPYPFSGHAVVQHLIDTKRIDALLARLIAGIELKESGMDVTADWLGWVKENLQRGGDPQELVEILKQHGFSHDSSTATVAGSVKPS